MKYYKLIVSGNIQGVGYRYYVQMIANKMKIIGTVKNLENGDVEVYVKCDFKDLENFISKISTPQHRLMKINKINYTEINEIILPENFKILY